VIEHAHAWNKDRKEGRHLCYKPSQQNQVHKHQCEEMETFLWRHVSTASAISVIKPEHSRRKPQLDRGCLAPPGWESLKSETVKCGHESRGTRAWEWLRWRGPAAIVNDRPIFSSERMLHKDNDHKCSVEKKNLLVVDLKGLGSKPPAVKYLTLTGVVQWFEISSF
jgi:hypothetical protein